MAGKNVLFILFCLMFTLCGCGRVRGTPVEVVSCYQDDHLMERYGNVYTDYVSVEYEQIIIEWQDSSGREIAIGPHEPKYRGIIHLNPKQAEQLMKSYEWAEDTTQIVFDSMEYDWSNSDIWYSSSDFEEDLFSKIFINCVYFNGTDAIIFEIKVM